MNDATAMPRGEPAIRTIAMPADANPAGDIFGGWLMAQMDLAANVPLPRVVGHPPKLGEAALAHFAEPGEDFVLLQDKRESALNRFAGAGRTKVVNYSKALRHN